jgi:hypothetical protein
MLRPVALDAHAGRSESSTHAAATATTDVPLWDSRRQESARREDGSGGGGRGGGGGGSDGDDATAPLNVAFVGGCVTLVATLALLTSMT